MHRSAPIIMRQDPIALAVCRIPDYNLTQVTEVRTKHFDILFLIDWLILLKFHRQVPAPGPNFSVAGHRTFQDRAWRRPWPTQGEAVAGRDGTVRKSVGEFI